MFKDLKIGWDAEDYCHRIYSGRKINEYPVTITTWQSFTSYPEHSLKTLVSSLEMKHTYLSQVSGQHHDQDGQCQV